MKSCIIKVCLLLSLSLGWGFTSAAFAADPTVHEIYQSANSGHPDKALVQIDQVLSSHPQSAKAHFVKAELLTRLGRNSEAKTELATAEQLQPGLPFAKPAAVQGLKAKLTAPTGNAVLSTAPAASARSSSFPWLWVIVGMALLFGVIYFIRSLIRSRQQMVLAGNGAVAGGGSYGPQAGYPAGTPVGPMGPMGGMAGPMAGGTGSGLLGSLATGAAVGAGMVAGEALMHRVINGGDHRADQLSSAPQNDFTPNSFDDANQYDMGGNDFGIADNSSWDSGSDLGSGSDSSDW